MYGSRSLPLPEEMRRLVRANRRLSRTGRVVRLDALATGLLEAQYRVASHFAGLLQNPAFHGHGREIAVLFHAFNGSVFHFWSALQLSRSGFTGCSRPLFRLVFEGLLLAKACSRGSNPGLSRRWAGGDPYLSVNRDVLKRLASPKAVGLSELWATLCRPAHFSVHSGQPSLEPDPRADDVWSNYTVLLMLLMMNSHLLRRHLLDRRINYYVGRYGEDSWPRDRAHLGRVTRAVGVALPKPSRRAVREYCAQWTFA